MASILKDADKQSPMVTTEQFQRLATQWIAETAHLSSMTQRAIHPAYQRIIGMGPAAVPMILALLASEPRRWFWALNAITGADPVPDESRGNVAEAAKAWREWGRLNGQLRE